MILPLDRDLIAQWAEHGIGLCGSHYMAWYRHRQANGIDTRKDFAA